MKNKILMNRSSKHFAFLCLLISLYFTGTDSSLAEQNVPKDDPNNAIPKIVAQKNLTPKKLEQKTEQQQNIVLKSDRSRMDGKTLIFEYCGNAILTQPGLELTADCLIGKKNKDGSYESITAKGEPAFLTQINLEKNEKLAVKANFIEYKIQSQQFLIVKNAKLKLTSKSQDSIEITADRIELDNKIEAARDIAATGAPLQIELIKSGITELKAKSKKLHFNTKTSNLKLSEEVIANLELGQISAGLFNYNSETKVSSFEKPPGEGKQVEIIQTKKQL